MLYDHFNETLVSLPSTPVDEKCIGEDMGMLVDDDSDDLSIISFGDISVDQRSHYSDFDDFIEADFDNMSFTGLDDEDDVPTGISMLLLDDVDFAGLNMELVELKKEVVWGLPFELEIVSGQIECAQDKVSGTFEITKEHGIDFDVKLPEGVDPSVVDLGQTSVKVEDGFAFFDLILFTGATVDIIALGSSRKRKVREEDSEGLNPIEPATRRPRMDKRATRTTTSAIKGFESHINRIKTCRTAVPTRSVPRRTLFHERPKISLKRGGDEVISVNPKRQRPYEAKNSSPLNVRLSEADLLKQRLAALRSESLRLHYERCAMGRESRVRTRQSIWR